MYENGPIIGGITIGLLLTEEYILPDVHLKGVFMGKLSHWDFATKTMFLELDASLPIDTILQIARLRQEHSHAEPTHKVIQTITILMQGGKDEKERNIDNWLEDYKRVHEDLPFHTIYGALEYGRHNTKFVRIVTEGKVVVIPIPKELIPNSCGEGSLIDVSFTLKKGGGNSAC